MKKILVTVLLCVIVEYFLIDRFSFGFPHSNYQSSEYGIRDTTKQELSNQFTEHYIYSKDSTLKMVQRLNKEGFIIFEMLSFEKNIIYRRWFDSIGGLIEYKNYYENDSSYLNVSFYRNIPNYISSFKNDIPIEWIDYDINGRMRYKESYISLPSDDTLKTHKISEASEGGFVLEGPYYGKKTCNDKSISYYENGQIQEIIFYNLLGQKDSLKEYDLKGRLIKFESYIDSTKKK